MTVRSRHVLVAVTAALWAVFAVGTLAVSAGASAAADVASADDLLLALLEALLPG